MVETRFVYNNLISQSVLGTRKLKDQIKRGSFTPLPGQTIKEQNKIKGQIELGHENVYVIFT